MLALTPENIRRVLTLIIACKANWWQTNHHTGTTRDSASGYVGNVLNAVFGQNTQAYVTLAHTISHWCSTILILRKAAVPHLRNDIVSAIDEPANFTLGADAMLRFSSGPAGIHRFIVADAIARRIVQHTVMEYYTNPQSLIALHTRTAQLVELGPQVHIGAHYLTKIARPNIGEELVQANLGRLGSWLRVFQPQ